MAVKRMREDMALTPNQYRQGLRVKGVQGRPGIYEMTWHQNGRATFKVGESIHEGEPHIVWLRIGGHEIF